MNSSWRIRFLIWLFARCGIAEGMVLPWWAQAVSCVLIPSRLLWLAVGRWAYDVSTQMVRVGDNWVSLRALERIFLPKHSTRRPWFRMVDYEDGRLGIEVLEVENQPEDGGAA